MSCDGKLMEKVQDLSQSELEDLVDNAEKVESMVLESDEIQSVQLEREMALASNRSLAEQNLSLKPRLERDRDRLVEKYSELEGVRERYRRLCTQRDGVMGQVTPEGLLSRLQTEGANTEAESEMLADQFLDGSLSLDSFLERFLSLRSLAHKRRVRIEKLQEILRQKGEGGAGVAGAALGPMASQQSANQEAAAPLPWQHQQQTELQQDNDTDPKPNHVSFPNPSQSITSPPLPYTPYPVSPPNPPPTVSTTGPPIPPGQFGPYAQPAFPSGPGFTPNPGFGPTACPYPTQPTFPSQPGSQFRPYGSPSPPYPSPFPGYNYPTGPSLPPSQPPPGRPYYRPGFGVPQP